MRPIYAIYARRIFGTVICALPFIAYAQAFTDFLSFGEFVLRILGGVIAILFALSALGLLYGVVLFFANSDNEAKREQIKGYLLWSVIGIAVMFAVWGIVQVIFNSFFGGGGFGIPFISPPTS